MRKRSFLFPLSLSFFLLSLLFLVASRKSASFAGFINSSFGATLRSSLLFISNGVPFSLFELLIVLTPAFMFLSFFFLKSKNKVILRRRFLAFISVFLFIFSLFINTLLIGYGVDTVKPQEEVTENELYSSLTYLSQKANSIEKPEYPSVSRLSEKLFLAYQGCEFPELSVTLSAPKIKKIKNARLASRLGILGNYGFLTSEISLNFSAPSYTLPFSAAHEMAHLFGISGEAEASFFAYIASIRTGDAAIMYSAYLTAFEYVSAELLYDNRELYFKAFSSLSESCKNDVNQYKAFYASNNSKITDSSNSVNEALLDALDKNGESSYGAFTDLLVSYFISNGIL